MLEVLGFVVCEGSAGSLCGKVAWPDPARTGRRAVDILEFE
jgi:hypothetical protein